MGSHSKQSPSSSARWLYCTASVDAIEADIAEGRIIPDPPDYNGGPAAHWGTCCHEISEYMLLGDDYSKLEGADDPEMIKCATDYVEYVQGLMREGSTLFVEVRVPLSDWLPDAENSHGEMEEQGGTSDTIIIHTDGSMDVVDLKGGAGIFVEVEGNTQARLYGLGALAEFDMIYDIEKIRNHIVQPRRDNYAMESLTRDELVTWAEETVAVAVDQMATGNTVFAPSDKACQWCERKGFCKARVEQEMVGIVASIDELDNPIVVASVEHLTLKQMATLQNKAGEIKALLKDVEAKMFERLQSGKKTTGFKLVEAKTNRKWAASESAIAKAMLKQEGVTDEDVYVTTKKLIGIGAAEKLVGKGKLDAYMTKPSGHTVMAPTSDKRPSVKPLIDQDMMDDLEDTSLI